MDITNGHDITFTLSSYCFNFSTFIHFEFYSFYGIGNINNDYVGVHINLYCLESLQ